MDRNKSMLCPHLQIVPKVLWKAPLTSWAVACRGVQLGSQLFLGKWDQLQDTTQPGPKVTLTSVRPSTCCPFHDSWDSLKSVTSNFVWKPGWLKKIYWKKPKAHNLFNRAVLLNCILQALPHRHMRKEETAISQLKICRHIMNKRMGGNSVLRKWPTETSDHQEKEGGGESPHRSGLGKEEV